MCVHVPNKKIKSLTSLAGTHTCGAASPLCSTCLRPLFKSYKSLEYCCLSKVLIGRLNAISVYFAWAGVLSIFVLLSINWWTETELANTHFMATFVVFLFFGLVHIVLAFQVRCPHCGKGLTIQGFKEPHPNSDGDWATTIFKWFGGKVRCIHCGNAVDTNDL